LERLEARKGEASVASHFLGTIVLEQTPNPTGSLPRREVIDGQQRLTTLQILLKAAEHALAEVGAKADEPECATIAIARRQIASLTENPAFAEEEERYKVWPTNEDRSSYRLVLDSTAEAGVGAARGKMFDAYRYFRETFTSHLLGDDKGPRAQRFAAALKDYLKVIVLDLDPSDEPQAIFETLNAHGTPLLSADLVKNWMLWEANRQKLELLPLYESYWRPFDREHEYWRVRTGTGHAARARIDTFLQNWLTKETMETISAKHLYDRFLRHIATLKAASLNGAVDVPELLANIRRDADLYERIDKPSGNGRFDRFLQRLKVMDVIVLHPVLLALMGRPGSDTSDLEACAVAIESYLVRRMICRYQTRGYGALALRLLKVIADTGADEPVADALQEHLRASATGSEAWPDDESFKSEWVRRKFYNGLRRDRVLMILQALEETYQGRAYKAEPLMTFDWSKLQIEHILPQHWLQHWTLTDGLTPEDRDWALHGIGNLTLVSERLNPSLSNAPWLSTESSAYAKREALKQHSRLEINRRLLDHHEIWNETEMRKRAEQLFEEARIIWPPCPTADAAIGLESSNSSAPALGVS
jgi:hypothetical protein